MWRRGLEWSVLAGSAVDGGGGDGEVAVALLCCGRAGEGGGRP